MLNKSKELLQLDTHNEVSQSDPSNKTEVQDLKIELTVIQKDRLLYSNAASSCPWWNERKKHSHRKRRFRQTRKN